MNPGNHSEGPGGGKEAPCHVTVGGKHGGCIETRGRVHETKTDSKTRSTKSGDGIHVSVPFERPDRVPDRTDPERRQPPGSFDLLGFTHYWARSRNGNWVVKRKTSTSRFCRGLQALSRWCQINRHQPLTTQHQTLSQKLMGHFVYYGITGNSSGLGRFRSAAKGIWRHWLSRRKRGRRMPWARFYRVLERYPLPPAIAIHSVCRP